MKQYEQKLQSAAKRTDGYYEKKQHVPNTGSGIDISKLCHTNNNATYYIASNEETVITESLDTNNSGTCEGAIPNGNFCQLLGEKIMPFELNSNYLCQLMTSFYEGGMEVTKEYIKTQEAMQRNENKINSKCNELFLAEEIRDGFKDRRALKTYQVFVAENKFQITVFTPGKVSRNFRTLIDEEVTKVKKLHEDRINGNIVMEITFKTAVGEKVIRYSPMEMIEYPQRFIPFLRKNGVHVHASEQAKADIAIELLNCIEDNAVEIFVSSGKGYFLDRYGKWAINNPYSSLSKQKDIRWPTTENEKRIFLLKLFSAVFPVLSSWGVYASLPFILNVSSRINNLVEDLMECESKVYTASRKKCEILDALKSISFAPFCFFHDGSFKANSRVMEIVNAVKTGIQEESKLKRFPIILTEDVQKLSGIDKYFCLNVIGESKRLSVLQFLPEPYYFSLIKEEVDKIETEYEDIGRYMYASICFLLPICKSTENLNILKELKESIDILLENHAQAEDTSGLSLIFVQELLMCFEDTEELELVALENVTRNDMEEKDKRLFHNELFLYISTNLFEQICERVKHIASTEIIKMALIEENILVKFNSSHTARMTVRDEVGNIYRPRMLKLILEKFETKEGLKITDL